MSARRDALLAAITLAGYAALVAVAEVNVSVPVAVAGGGAVVLLEALAGRHATAVRRAWERPAVQAVALVGALALGAAAALAGVAVVLSLVVGGVAAYLALLALVRIGVLPRPEDWPFG